MPLDVPEPNAGVKESMKAAACPVPTAEFGGRDSGRERWPEIPRSARESRTNCSWWALYETRGNLVETEPAFCPTFRENLRRFVVGGMHIHIGFGGANLRIRVMTALRRHLPLPHVLSCSSPFNEGSRTGFKSYQRSPGLGMR